MRIDIESFWTPIADAPSCGLDLVYDPDFMALESVTRGKEEQQYGETVIPAVPPDWREVEKRSEALMARSKDLRVVVSLSRAWTHTKGLAGFSAGMQIMVELLERYWDAVHPMPEDNDYYVRMKAVSALCDPLGMLRDLRDVEFVRTSHGVVTLREAEAVANGSAGELAVQMTADQLAMAVSDHLRQTGEVNHPCISALKSVQHIRSYCEEKLSVADRPDLSALVALLTTVARIARPDQSSVDLPQDASTESGQGEQHARPASASGLPGTAVSSRDDAIAKLLAIAQFVEQSEPTNPAPMLIRRAARMMRMNFIEVMRDLSPESLVKLEILAGIKLEGSN